MREQVAEDIKEERLARLNALQNRITEEIHAAEVGKTRDVLILYQSRKAENTYYGRTEHFHLVKVSSPRDIRGELLPVRIANSNRTALAGMVDTGN